MIMYEDECVGCPKEIGCYGESCPMRHVPHFYCDKCDEEFGSDELYIYEDKHLCQECLLDNFEKLE